MMAGKLRRSIWLSHPLSPGVRFHPRRPRGEDSEEVTVHPSPNREARRTADAVKSGPHEKGTRSPSPPELNQRVKTTSDRSRADSRDGR